MVGQRLVPASAAPSLGGLQRIGHASSSFGSVRPSRRGRSAAPRAAVKAHYFELDGRRGNLRQLPARGRLTDPTCTIYTFADGGARGVLQKNMRLTYLPRWVDNAFLPRINESGERVRTRASFRAVAPNLGTRLVSLLGSLRPPSFSALLSLFRAAYASDYCFLSGPTGKEL